MSLSGWNESKKLTLTFDSPASDQTDFVACVLLNSSAGINNFDNTAVFTELAITEEASFDPTNKHSDFTVSGSTATKANDAWRSGYGDIALPTSGKYYFEFKTDTSTASLMLGIGKSGISVDDLLARTADGYAYSASNGYKWNNNTSSAYGDAYNDSSAHVVGIAFDADTGSLWFSLDGVWQNSGDPEAGTGYAFTGLSGTFYPMYSVYHSGAVLTEQFNFSDLTYTPPDGFIPFGYDGPLKVAFEIGDTGAQCYAEKSNYERTAEIAQYYVKIPSALAASQPVLNLYYDSTHADNSTYIGAPASIPSQTVWADANVVYSSPGDPSGTAPQWLDSTGSDADLTSDGSMTSGDLITLNGRKAISLDGVNDNLYSASDSAVLSMTEAVTLEIILTRRSHSSSGYGIIHKGIRDFDTYGDFGILGSSTDERAYFNINGNSTGVGINSILVDDNRVHLVGTYDRTTIKFYANGTLGNSVAETAALTTTYDRLLIGEYWDPSINGEFDVEFVRVMDTAMSADAVAYTFKSIDDNLITWSSSALLELSNYLDQTYGDAYVTISNYLNQLYHLLSWNQAYVEQVYGLHLGAHLDMFYENAPTIQAYIAQWYKDAGLLKNYLEQEYWDAQQLKAMLEQSYVIPKELKAYVEAIYHTMSRYNQSYLTSYYDIKDTSILKRHLDKLYALAPEGTFLSQDNSAVVGGTALDIVAVVGGTALDIVALDVEFSQGSYVGDVTIQLKDKAQWMPLDYEQPIVVTCGTDVYNFELTEKNKKEDHKGYTITIGGKSPAYKLDFPYASPVPSEDEDDPADSFTLNAMASDICTRLAALEGIILSWEIPVDWYLTSKDVEVVGESPINAIRKIVSEVKAIIQSDPDGSIYVEPLNIVDTNARDTAPPDYYLTSGANLYTTDSSLEKRDGYNSFSITNVEDSYQYTIEHEVVSATEILVKVFQPTWTSDEVILSTSETDSTVITRLPDVFDSAQCELVEIVAGAGSISKPVGLASFDYKDNTNLGTVSVEENGEITTAIKGESLVEVIYNTQYRQWRVTNDEIESVQLILTRVE